MILRATDGYRGLFLNLDTNQPIRKMIWADLETGEYEAYAVDGNGDKIRDGKVSRKIRGKARLKFLPTTRAAVPKRNAGGNGGVPLPRAPKTRRRVKQRLVPLFSDFCEHPGCAKVANWMVSDETPLPPAHHNGRLYEMGKTVAVHYYCSWHYKPPRVLDANGEVMSVRDEAGGVRPQ